MKYSVLMSVYIKDRPAYLEESIKSILNQTILPDDFVIVKDGCLTKKLDNIIAKYQNQYDFINVLSLEKNSGLGNALKIGLLKCKNEIVARMDADDHSFPTRMETQLKFLENNPDIDIVGLQIIEFIDDINNPCTLHDFPLNHEEIVKYAHSRNPFSHPTVMFRKSKVIEAGNYEQFYLCEDYDLWIRMIKNGCKCANIEQRLLAFRVGSDFYKRRGGIKYVKSINNLMRRNMKNGFFTKKDYLKNIIIRSTIYLMPNNLRGFIYSKFLRKRANHD